MEPLNGSTNNGTDSGLTEDKRYHELEERFDDLTDGQKSKFDFYVEKAAVSKIVDQLKTEIAKSGKSYYQLSKETGIDSASISRFMSGERTIGFPAAAVLIETLGLALQKPKRRGKSLVASEFDLPYGSKEFAQSWEESCTFKKSERRGYKKEQAQKLLDLLSEWGEKESIMAIDVAIAGGYKIPRHPQQTGHWKPPTSDNIDEPFFEGEDANGEMPVRRVRTSGRGMNGIEIKGGSIF